MAEDIWKKIASNIIPILLAALLSVIGFVVLQIILLNNKMNENKIQDIQHYMELCQKFEVQKVTIGVLKDRIDRMNHSREGVSYEDFSQFPQLDYLSYRDNNSNHSLDFRSDRE